MLAWNFQKEVRAMDYEFVLSGGTDKVEGKVLGCFQTATVSVDQIFKINV